MTAKFAFVYATARRRPMVEPLESRRVLAAVAATAWHSIVDGAVGPVRPADAVRSDPPQAVSSPGTRPLALNAEARGVDGIRLKWLPLGLPADGEIVVFRKLPTAAAWPELAIGQPAYDATQWDDPTATPGLSYEYKVVVYTTLGAAPYEKYVLAGNSAAPDASRGSVLLVVDETQLNAGRDAAGTTLAPALARYRAGLVAEGYRVHQITAPRVDVPRTTPSDASPGTIAAHYGNWASQVMTLKSRIRAVWQSDPALSSVLLVGHVAVPFSGIVNPDGTSHVFGRGAWPADVFYGTLAAPDSVWTDEADGGGVGANANFIGDGKFDQDRLEQLGAGTSWEGQVFADVAVGRVDLSQLAIFAGVGHDVGAAARPGETKLIARYFDKVRAWKAGQVEVKRQALFDEAFPFGEYYDANRLAPNVGIGQVKRGTSNAFEPNLNAPHEPHPPGTPPTTAYDLNQDTWLWMYAGGSGYPSRNVVYTAINHMLRSDQYANGAYSSEFDGTSNHDFGTHKSVFNFAFGSYVGDWDYLNSLLRSIIAEPEGLGLASAWGARPNWQQHHMGLGESIGHSQAKTWNNFAARQSYGYDPNNGGTRVTLLGDPTLRQDNVKPASNVRYVGNGQLTWAASADPLVAGYDVYRSATPDGPFTQVNDALVTGTAFTDTGAAASANAYYLVRALKLEQTPSGTYWNVAVGAPAAPAVASATFDARGQQGIDVTFTHDVGPSLTAADLVVGGQRYDFTTRQLVPFTLAPGVGFTVASYDPATRTARVAFTGVDEFGVAGRVPSGRYTLSFVAGAVVDGMDAAVDAGYSFAFANLAGDTNGDLRVDFTDLLAFASRYGSTNNTNGPASGDYDDDGDVDFSDLLVLAKHYGTSF